jgi:hypothetical protein
LLASSLAIIGSSCGGTVRDTMIQNLGPEDPAVPIGPEHRPGQPCVLCHEKGGPAASKPFAIAGTIYKTAKAGAAGATDVFVQFRDARGGGPVVSPQSGESGNFYVPLQDWPDMTFPIRVGLYKNLNDPPAATMQSLIGREPSCNFCHRPLPSGDLSDDQLQATRSSAGAIVFAGK